MNLFQQMEDPLAVEAPVNLAALSAQIFHYEKPLRQEVPAVRMFQDVKDADQFR